MGGKREENEGFGWIFFDGWKFGTLEKGERERGHIKEATRKCGKEREEEAGERGKKSKNPK